jgi:glycosyltransferase involved in cell wall biosynthesis
MTAFAIAPYPLSQAFREGLADLYGGEVELLDVPTLRRLPARAMAAELRARRGRHCLLPLEDPASAALLPVLELLAVAAGPSRIEIVDAALRRRPVSRARAAAAAAGLARASLACRRAAGAARLELAALQEAPRRATRPGSGSRVLHLNANLWFGVQAGGSIGHVAGVVNGLLARGTRVDVAAVARPPLVRPEAGFLPLVPPRRYGLPTELNQYRFSRSVTAQLAERLRRGRYRYLYQRLSLGNYAGAALSRAAGVPLVLEYNGSEVWTARHWGERLRHEQLALAAEAAVLRHAHLVVTVSSVLGEELERRGVERDRVVVHPNGVDPERFDPKALASEAAELRARLGLAPADVVAAFVGTFGRWHGADVLARAVRALADRERAWLDEHRLRFLLVGDGLRMGEVRELLGEPGLAVTSLTGIVPQEQAPAYLAASDILLSPHVPNPDGTPFFGSPTKLFEYMAAGRAIVASDLDQIGEVLQPALCADALPSSLPAPNDASVAVLARPGDPDGLARAIRFLAERPEWRLLLGANARELARARYTWGHHVAAISERVDRLGAAA